MNFPTCENMEMEEAARSGDLSGNDFQEGNSDDLDQESLNRKSKEDEMRTGNSQKINENTVTDDQLVNSCVENIQAPADSVTGFALHAAEIALNLTRDSKTLNCIRKCLICGPTPEITQAEYTKLTSCLDIRNEIYQLLKNLSPPNETDACCGRCLDLMRTFINLKSSLQSVKQKIISLHVDAKIKHGDSCNSGVSEPEDDDGPDCLTTTFNKTNQEQVEELVIKHENIDIEYEPKINKVRNKVTTRSKRPKKKYTPVLKRRKCQYCDKTYSSKLKLIEHERTHTGEKPFKCQYCSRKFHRKISCVSHEKTEHIENPFRCKMCFKKFQTKEECEEHEKTHTAPRPHKCQYCTRTYERKDECTRHERIHTGEKPFKCLHCEKKFSVKSARKRHEKTKHQGMKLSREESAQKNKVEKKDIHSCDHCESSFDKKDDLLEHEKVHEFKCSHCAKSCWGMKALKQHERYHTKEKPFKCTFCDMAFSYEWTFKEHLRIHTGERPYICQYCSKSFIQRGSLTVHERSLHLGVKPYKCQYCEEGFPTRRLREEHERFHTGEKPFKCDICAKTFVRKSIWAAHVKTHLGLKPQVCSYCGKGFRDRSSLVRHERTHTGERPYRCRFCDKTFVRRNYCTTHEKTHTGEKVVKNQQPGNKQKGQSKSPADLTHKIPHSDGSYIPIGQQSDMAYRTLHAGSTFTSGSSENIYRPPNTDSSLRGQQSNNVFPTSEALYPGNNTNPYMYNMYMPGM